MKKLMWPTLALVGIFISAFFWDQKLCLAFDTFNEKSQILREVANDITGFGKSEQWFALAILVYFCCWVLPQINAKKWSSERLSNLKNWSLHLFSALILSGLLLHVVKIIFGRQRPYKTLDHEALVFHPFTMDWDFGSFASGHTQTLFCVASLLVILWPKRSLWIWFVAAFFAFTRIVAIQHFLSDVIGGVLIGIYGTQLSMYWLSKKVPRPAALP